MAKKPSLAACKVFAAAARLVAKGWCQGSSWAPRFKPNRCERADDAVSLDYSLWLAAGCDTGPGRSVYYECCAVLGAQLGGASLWKWNDMEGRTQEDVARLLKEAARGRFSAPAAKRPEYDVRREQQEAQEAKEAELVRRAAERVRASLPQEPTPERLGNYWGIVCSTPGCNAPATERWSSPCLYCAEKNRAAAKVHIDEAIRAGRMRPEGVPSPYPSGSPRADLIRAIRGDPTFKTSGELPFWQWGRR